MWEWCEDDWHSTYESAPCDGNAWVETNRDVAKKLLRGGAWNNYPGYCRSAYRVINPRDIRFNSVGFRVCCVPPRLSS